MQSSVFKPLFTSFNVGGLSIKNRFVMCAMGGVKIYNLDASPSEKVYEYYIERAKGGVGLIITRAIIALPIGLKIKLYEHEDIFRPMEKLTREVHKYGCKIFMQISGGAGRTLHQTIENMANKGISYKDAFFAASDGIPNVWYPDIKHRGLTKDEIYQYIYAFGKIAKIAKKVGFDGVEVHAIHEGYLIDQFTVSCTNNRDDEFGGSLENRFRLPCEIIKSIKKECGVDFPVSVRYSVTSKMKDFNLGPMPFEAYNEFGRNLDEAILGAKLLQDAGCDMLNTDNGSYDSWYWAHPPVYMPEECNLNESVELKKHIDIPVVCAGKMDNPTSALSHIKKGDCDAIGIARALLVDPFYVNKIQKGNIDDIKPCIGCHNGCLGKVERGNTICCALNPQLLNESYYKDLSQIKVNKKIAVIGGGIAGIEVSLILSKHGCDVILYEKENILGGVFNIASSFDFKKRDKKLLKWYMRQLELSDIKVQTGKYIRKEDLECINVDDIIVATGATPKQSFFEANIVNAIDYIKNYKPQPDKNLIVIGGGLTGCEIAYNAAKDGSNVTIVDTAGDILINNWICSANRLFLLHAFKSYKVNILCNSFLKEIVDNQAIIESKDGLKQTLVFDKVIAATGYENYRPYGNNINDKKIHYIGDVNNVGNLMSAISDAYNVAYEILLK